MADKTIPVLKVLRGNVGIGSTTPTSNLEVIASGADLENMLRVTSGTAGRGVYIGAPQSATVAGVIDFRNGNVATRYLDFRGEGTSRMVIQTDGNVGIGTNAPEYPLHISDADSAIYLVGSDQGRIILQDTGATSNSQAFDIVSKEDKLHFRRLNNGRDSVQATVMVLSGDKVGIGTTAPGGILSIGSSNESYFSSNAPNTLNFFYNTNSDTGGWINYRGYQDGTTQTRDLIIGDGKGNKVATFDGSTKRVGIGTDVPAEILTLDSSSNTRLLLRESGGNKGQISAGGGGLYIQNLAGDVIFRNISDADTVRIKNDGKVGIGTTVPECKLDIHDHTSATTFIADNNAGVRITNWGGSTGWSLLGFGGFSTSYEKNLAQIGSLSSNAGTYLAFGTSNSYSAGITNQAMTIDPSGNVGIGTTSPAAMLEVIARASGGHPPLFLRRGANNESASLKLLTTTTEDWIVGMRNDGTSNFRIYSYGASSDVFSILRSNGNVGIGTTAPATTLDVNGITTFRDYLKIGAAGVHGVITWGGGLANTVNFIGASGKNLSLGTDGAYDKLVIKTDGKVGIGTTDPKYDLQVNGDIALGPQGANTTKTICSARSDGGSTNRAAIRFVTNSNYDESLSFDVLDSGVAGYPDALKIDYTGNVGIGTNVPSTKLQVNDTSDSRLLIYETGASPYTATLELASQAVGTYGALIQYTSGAERLTIQNYGRTASNNSNMGGIAFKTKLNNTTPTEVMSIHGFSGNVGIGDITPSYKLDVNGTFRVTGAATFDSSIGFATVLAGNGTASLPSFAFTNDPNTGMYNDGANDNLKFSTGGVVRAFLTATQWNVSGNIVGVAGIFSGAVSGTTATFTDVMNLSGVNKIHQLSGHNFVQGDATMTYLYGGSGGGQIRTTNNASSLVQWLDNGNVGIGTTSPSSQFHVYDGTAVDAFKVENYNRGAVWNSVGAGGMYSEYQLTGTWKFRLGQANHLVSGASVNNFALSYAGDLLFSSSVTERMRITSTGKVGIGRTDPSTKLVVNGIFDASATPSVSAPAANSANKGILITREAASGWGTGYTYGIDFGVSNSINAASQYKVAAIYGAVESVPYYIAGKLGFYTTTGGNGALLEERMTIKASGSVGIGTTAPVQKLDVAGNINITGANTNTGFDRYFKMYGNSDPATNTNRWAGIGLYNNGGNNVNELAFFTGTGDGARTEKVRINNLGNVGIGTTDPGQKLHVNGNILVNAQILTPGGSNLQLNPNTGLVTVGGALTATGNITGGAFGPIVFTSSTQSIKWPNTSGQSASRSWGWMGEQGAYGYFQLYRSDASDGTLDTEVMRFRNTGNAEFRNSLLVDGNITCDSTIFTSEYIKHYNDDDNWLRFTTDAISFSKPATFSGTVACTTITTSATLSTFADRIKIVNGSAQLNIGQWDTVNHRIEADANRPLMITSYEGNINLGISGNTRLNVHNAGIAATGNITATGKLTVGSSVTATSKAQIHSTQSNTMTDAEAFLALKGNGGDGMLMGQRASSPYGAWIQAGYLPNIGTSHHYPLLLQPHGSNVGIGTTAPDEKLEIYDGYLKITDAVPTMVFERQSDALKGYITSNVGYFQFSYNTKDGDGYIKMDVNTSGGSAITHEGNGYLRLGANSVSNQLVLAANGKVGIGTGTPTATLHVSDSGTTDADGYSLAKSDADAQSLRTYHNGTNWVIAPKYGTQGGLSDLHLQASTGNTAGLLINRSTGNVGIGTTTPEATLTLAGPSGTHAIFRSNEATASQRAGGGFSSAGNATAASRYARMFLDADGGDFSGVDYFTIEKFGGGHDNPGGEVKLINYSDSNMSFWVNTSVRAMTIEEGGQIGIGTAAPSAKLDVRSPLVSQHAIYSESNTAYGSPLYLNDIRSDASMEHLIRLERNTNLVGYVSSDATHLVMNAPRGYMILDGADGTIMRDSGSNKVIQNGSYFRPDNNNDIYLGSSGARWANTYSVLGNFSGDVTINSLTIASGSSDTIYANRSVFGLRGNTSVNLMPGGTTRLLCNSSGITVTGNIIPAADGTYNLGSTSSQDWKELYIREIDMYNQRLRIYTSAEKVIFRDHSTIGQGITFQHRNSEVMTIGDASGNERVGIGTSTPQSLLHVYGAARFNTATITGTATNLPFLVATTNGSDMGQFTSQLTTYARLRVDCSNPGDAQVSFMSAQSSKWSIGNDAGDSHKFKIKVGFGAFSGAETFMIQTDGNIGIGTNTAGYKFHVQGDILASGAIMGNSKSFVIDHPTKPNHKLQYGALEGPEFGVYHRGRAQSDTITLPDYWSGLVRDGTVTVQLTPNGSFQHLYVVSTSLSEIKIGAAEGETIDCYYTIYGERADLDPLVVEKIV